MIASVGGAASHAVLHDVFGLRREFCDQPFGGPDFTVTCQVGQASGLVDGVAEYRQFDAGRGLEGAEPFLAFIEADIHVQFVEPAFANLPGLADPLRCGTDFHRATQGVEDVV